MNELLEQLVGEAPTVVALLVTMRLIAARLDRVNSLLGVLIGLNHDSIPNPPPTPEARNLP